MLQTVTRRRFLERVSCRSGGAIERPLGIVAEFTRDNVETACQALAFGLVSLVEEDDEGSYAFRITRAGQLLLDGRIEEAAALIDRGRSGRRVAAPPPWGVLAHKLRPGGPGISLKGSGPRAYATQLILAVASGHAIVTGTLVRGNANAPRFEGVGTPTLRPEAASPGTSVGDRGRFRAR